ncbi:MAG: 16S rRNA (uracil(1498)-N(3))-methyltransferase [Cellvibrionales bacterium TMED49]|nr:MAG: 16S rRNA (uracil(1498)-N(3))-methyltransferase [Cellvibrionales bacterium TMED49]
MNVLLIDKKNIRTDRTIVSGRQFDHLKKVLRVSVGDKIRVGVINELLGTGIVERFERDYISLAISANLPPPKAIPATVILSLPRPKFLNRIMQSLATMGVKDIHVIHSQRVEKSYWSTPQLNLSRIDENFILGLEQAGDTVVPNITLHKRFRPFVEDVLPHLMNDRKAFLAQPRSEISCPICINQPSLLVIGPEGGFIPYEVNKFENIGFQAVSIGDRIMKVEVAIPMLISRLYPGQ